MDERAHDLFLTGSQVSVFKATLVDLLGKSWSLTCPVFILNRCWLKLEKLRFDQLDQRLPPDKSMEAPELNRYNQLLKNGYNDLLAQEKCWQEFGMDEFHRAVRNYWDFQDSGNSGWTFNIYLELLSQYRKLVECSELSIPLIILGRNESLEPHYLKWISFANSYRSLMISSFETKTLSS